MMTIYSYDVTKTYTGIVGFYCFHSMVITIILDTASRALLTLTNTPPMGASDVCRKCWI